MRHGLARPDAQRDVQEAEEAQRLEALAGEALHRADRAEHLLRHVVGLGLRVLVLLRNALRDQRSEIC